MEKNILGIIPARGGSKGVPGKNIREICGKPLIQYIYETTKKSKYITRLILSTDDDKIASIGRSIGMEVPFMRPKELATDKASSISVVKHALNHFDENGARFDGVISVQATNPFTSTSSIERVIELWLETGCDSVTTLAEVTKGHPYITKRMKPGSVIEPFCNIPEGISIHRRQDREPAYFMTGAIYMRGRELVKAENMDGHYLGKDSRAVVVDEMESIDINTPFDFEVVEWIISKGENRA